ncbi:hypothetical protein N7517_000914 [Penicillium concentricum]|uniref:Uncharacterized protein n=1 Tax=Penicillium concentricum TaxID=293559 RepID=A0A9W9VI10_9EURO|nr:uncharacterized protein N7517_000914 [Penicillium concentricum]KAJ5383003.1 hypothetical protein N7517_000914 [Penicillium concentricum]
MNDTIITTRGWVPEPDGRGTWGILSTCVLTIILCCWTSVFPNLPAQSDGAFKKWRYKFDLACIAILGSEFLLILALGQWSSARCSVKPPETDLLPSFPLDAKQLYILVKEGYVEYPILEEEEIKDKSKADGLSRLMAIVQVLWFSLNCIFRFAQGLFLTTLELTTLSFILVFLVTSYCWSHKPMDIDKPIILKLKKSVVIIRENLGRNSGSKWYETPLDFLSRDEWFCARFWKYYVQILHYIHIPLFTRPERRPYDRIPSHFIPNMDTQAEIICAPTILLFSSVFLIAWNSAFPSATEKLLWRIASVNSLAFALIAGPLSLYFHRKMFQPELAKARAQAALKRKRGSKNRWISRLAARLRNIDPEQDPNLEIPLRALIPISFVCAFYCVGRGFILTEDLIGLRSLPESAYQTVSWSKYVPHW